MKKINKEFHVSNSKIGHGDNQGTAIRNKMARAVDINGSGIAKIKTPPKALA